jgi:hypothetical protein
VALFVFGALLRKHKVPPLAVPALRLDRLRSGMTEWRTVGTHRGDSGDEVRFAGEGARATLVARQDRDSGLAAAFLLGSD